MKPDLVQKVVAACCLLHNFLMNEAKPVYCPDGYADEYNEDGELVLGSWRNNLPANSCFDRPFAPSRTVRNNDVGKLVRERIKLYM
jgi:hypothetical protein